MGKFLFHILIILFCTNLAQAQSYRSVEGYGNNTAQPEWGAVGELFHNFAGTDFSDSIGAPAGINRVPVRPLSVNHFWERYRTFDSNVQLSSFVWTWGKFIDHDIHSIALNPQESLPIEIGFDDPFLSDLALREIPIPMTRALAVEGTGTDKENPRKYSNTTTAWIDGSMVYGNSTERAAWLRTFEGGKMKTSEGNFLPFNTKDGNFNSNIDPDAPSMINLRMDNDKVFVAGDQKANESIQLLTLHTLFVREHNRLCDSLLLVESSWSDEELYQKAKSLVTGIIQKITYEEWLPTIGVLMPEYSGYNPELQPQVLDIYAFAAGNIGHSLLNTNIPRMDHKGRTIPRGDIDYELGFYNPIEFVFSGDIDNTIRGMATQRLSRVDFYVPLELRNFKLPGSEDSYIDNWAVAVNIGRERGLPGYNTIREALGFRKADTFDKITEDKHVASFLERIYNGDINDIDLWVGMMSERPLYGRAFGHMLSTVYQEQFRILRDSDRYFYKIDPTFNEGDLNFMNEVTLSEVILRNTEMITIQPNAFTVVPMSQWPRNGYSISEAVFDAAIFPNPTVEEFNIAINSMKDGEQCEVVIYSPNGAEVYKTTLELIRGNNVRIFSADLLPTEGVYVVRLNTEDESKTFKLMKVSKNR